MKAAGKVSQAVIALIILVLIPVLSALLVRIYGQGSPQPTGNSFLSAIFWMTIALVAAMIFSWVFHKGREVHKSLTRKKAPDNHVVGFFLIYVTV